MPRGAKPVLFVSPGDRFGHGVVLPGDEVRITRPAAAVTERGVMVACDCGNTYAASLSSLNRGFVTSCGCGGQDWDEQILRRQIRALARAAGYKVRSLTLVREDAG